MSTIFQLISQAVFHPCNNSSVLVCVGVCARVWECMCVLCVYVLQTFVFYNWFMAFVERLGKPHFNWFLHKNLIKLPEKAAARVKCVLHATTENK